MIIGSVTDAFFATDNSNTKTTFSGLRGVCVLVGIVGFLVYRCALEILLAWISFPEDH